MASTAAGSNYKKLSLRKDTVSVGVVQSRVEEVNLDRISEERKANLQHMLNLIDLAQAFGYKDLLAFHEFPLSGFSFRWNREQALRVAIDVPGVETTTIGEKAKKYNCYIEFGCYGKIKEWPNHFMNLGVIVGPTGEVIYRHWKTRNLSGMGFSTTVHDVLDRYVEMYGWDAVFPVCHTDIGNIAIIPESSEPEMGRAYAMKGTELVIRYMTAGAGRLIVNKGVLNYLGGPDNTFRLEFQAQCIQGDYWGVFVNNSLSKMGEAVFDLGAGHSAIIDNNGHILSEASSSEETVVMSFLPITEYRKSHEIPYFPKELYTEFYRSYVPKFPPNMFAKQLPNSIAESVAESKDFKQW